MFNENNEKYKEVNNLVTYHHFNTNLALVREQSTNARFRNSHMLKKFSGMHIVSAGKATDISKERTYLLTYLLHGAESFLRS